MKFSHKEIMVIITAILVAISVIIFLIYGATEYTPFEIWFHAPLSALTKGDIIIFIIAFGFWMKTDSKK